MESPKILILEDEVLTSTHLERVLRRFRYQVVGVARSGTAALELIAQTSPDLLLADIGLEGDLDGIEVAERARELWNLPTVFITAYSDPETLRRARITEPYGYVIKPFVEQELHASIEIALQQRAARAQQEHEASITAETLIRTQKELSEVTVRLFEAQEQERAAIARDLHDDIGQRLALLHIELETFWQQLPDGIRESLGQQFGKMMERAGELSSAVKMVSQRLHPAILDDLGLEVALRQLAENFEEHYLIPTRFSARGVPEDLPSEASVCLYRIAQEALRNTGQHAGQAQVNIALVGGPAVLDLSIRDTGVGFDPREVARPGLGLVSMVERASAIGARIRIDSRPGAGVRIHVTLPLTKVGDEAGRSERRTVTTGGHHDRPGTPDSD